MARVVAIAPPELEVEQIVAAIARVVEGHRRRALPLRLSRPGGQGAAGVAQQKSNPGDKAGWIHRDGHRDMFAALGAGKTRMYMIPSLKMVVVRQCDKEQDRYQDDAFLALLLGGNTASRDR